MKTHIYNIHGFAAAAVAAVATAVASLLCSCESKDAEGSSVAIVDDLYQIEYTEEGGIQAFVVYSDVGDWELKPTYEEDWEWITAWPASGRRRRTLLGQGR